MNTWQKYVAAVTGGATQTAIGVDTGIAQSTISRWLNATKVPTEAAQVAKFALAYKRNPLEAFVAAGMLTIAECDKGLNEAERALLRGLNRPSKPKVTDIRDRKVSRARDLERDLKAGKRSARRKDDPPPGE